MLESLGAKITETGKIIGDKSKQVIEVTQLGYKVTAAEKEKEALFAVLGKTVYEAACSDSESPYFAKCEEISAKQDEIDELKRKYHAAKGVIVCRSCGAECDPQNDYCGKCGAKLIKPVEAPAETAEDGALDEEKTEEE